MLAAALPLAVGCLALGGCTQQLPAQATGIQSMRVTLKDPTPDKLGTPGKPVSFTQMTVDITALGPAGELIAEDFDVDVYLSFAGNKVGQLTACGTRQDTTPLLRIHLTQGVALGQTVHLVKAFGAATLWVEEPNSHALGTSPVIYFAEPTIPDIQTPLDLKAPTASYCSPWSGRHVIVNSATGAGQLMVTSVFGSAFVVTDTGAPYVAGDTTSGFNNMYIFSFGAPPDAVQPGLLISTFSGNFSKFNGFTELNFPLSCWKTDGMTDSCGSSPGGPAMGTPPPPTVVGATERNNQTTLLQLAAGVVTATGTVCCIQSQASATQCCAGTAAPCAADDQWVKYNTFNLDVGGGCDAFKSYSVALSGKTMGDFDPLTLMGGTLKVTVTGMLKNSSGQNPACKDAADAVDVDCMTTKDCTDAGNALIAKNPNSACGPLLVKGSVSCIEGTCRRGVYNFWTIQPRTPDDIIAK